MDAHFFETSATLITFITLGKWLEASAKGRFVTLLSLRLASQADHRLEWEGERKVGSRKHTRAESMKKQGVCQW